MSKGSFRRNRALCAALVCLLAGAAGGAPRQSFPLLEAAHRAAALIHAPEERVNMLVSVARAYAALDDGEALRVLDEAQAAAPECRLASLYLDRIEKARRDVLARARGTDAGGALDAEMAESLLAAADELIQSGEAARALEVLDALSKKLAENAEGRYLTYLTGAAERYARLGRRAQAASVLQDVSDAVGDVADRALADRVLAAVAPVYGRLGDAARCRVLAARISAHRIRMRTLIGAGQGLSAAGRHEQARRLVDEACDAGRDLRPARQLSVIVKALAEWTAADPGDDAMHVARRAEEIARRISPATDRRNALRQVAHRYAALEQWSEAARIAGMTDDPAMLCTFQAETALQLGRQRRHDEAVRIMLSLDGDSIRALAPKTRDELGRIYVAARPGADVAQVMRIRVPELRDSTLLAYALAAARAGDCRRAMQWARAMSDERRDADVPRSTGIQKVARACLEAAGKANLRAALDAADVAVVELDSATRRLDVLFARGSKCLEEGDKDGAAETIENMQRVLKSVSIPHVRAEAMCRVAVLYADTGREGEARMAVTGAMAILQNIACGSCRDKATLAALADLSRSGSPDVLAAALNALTLPDMQIWACHEHAQYLKGITEETRIALLRGALAGALKFKYAHPRAKGLLEVDDIYRHVGVEPGEPETAMLQAAAPPVGRAPGVGLTDESYGGNTVRLVYFTSQGCDACQGAKEVINLVRAVNADLDIQVETYDLANTEGAEEFNRVICETLVVPERERGMAPAVFSGGGGLVHREITEEALTRLVRGSVGLPSPTIIAAAGEFSEQAIAEAKEVIPPPLPSRESGPGIVLLSLFKARGCAACRDARQLIEQIDSRRKDLKVNLREYLIDDPQAAALHAKFCRMAGLQEKDHLRTPAVFSSLGGLVGKDITREAVDRMIAAAAGEPAPEDEFGVAGAHDMQDVCGKVEGLTVAVVIAAGLADGIFNPCAFTVIIFFVSYLAHVGRGRREIATAGIVFSAAVFLTYFALGLGLARLLHIGESNSMALARIVLAVIAVLVLVAAFLSLRDGLRCLRGETVNLSLGLPEKFRSSIRRHITSRARMGLTIGTTAVVGVIVAMIELPCTGLVYLPVIALIQFSLARPECGSGPIGWLLVYNVFFIAPLLVTFVCVYLGTTSEQLTSFFRRRLAAFKFTMAVVFAALAAFLAAQFFRM